MEEEEEEEEVEEEEDEEKEDRCLFAVELELALMEVGLEFKFECLLLDFWLSPVIELE